MSRTSISTDAATWNRQCRPLRFSFNPDARAWRHSQFVPCGTALALACGSAATSLAGNLRCPIGRRKRYSVPPFPSGRPFAPSCRDDLQLAQLRAFVRGSCFELGVYFRRCQVSFRDLQLHGGRSYGLVHPPRRAQRTRNCPPSPGSGQGRPAIGLSSRRHDASLRWLQGPGTTRWSERPEGGRER